MTEIPLTPSEMQHIMGWKLKAAMENVSACMYVADEHKLPLSITDQMNLTSIIRNARTMLKDCPVEGGVG